MIYPVTLSGDSSVYYLRLFSPTSDSFSLILCVERTYALPYIRRYSVDNVSLTPDKNHRVWTHLEFVCAAQECIFHVRPSSLIIFHFANSCSSQTILPTGGISRESMQFVLLLLNIARGSSRRMMNLKSQRNTQLAAHAN